MPAFEMTRRTTVDAAPAAVHALVNDFRNWTRWSPWEDKDPSLERDYSGADRGVGSEYAWSGNAGRLFVDRALGKDFDRGLARLRAAAEAR